mgnify:CR=1 FL=1
MRARFARGASMSALLLALCALASLLGVARGGGSPSPSPVASSALYAAPEQCESGGAMAPVISAVEDDGDDSDDERREGLSRFEAEIALYNSVPTSEQFVFAFGVSPFLAMSALSTSAALGAVKQARGAFNRFVALNNEALPLDINGLVAIAE